MRIDVVYRQRCTQCERLLAEAELVWLELDQATGLYHREGVVEGERSQGFFPFGAACARAIVKRAGVCNYKKRRGRRA